MDLLTFKEAKEKIESKGLFTVVETEDEIRTEAKRTDGVYITYYKKTNEYTASGFGLGFSTYPIYKPWREMIKAWKRENAGAQDKL